MRPSNQYIAPVQIHFTPRLWTLPAAAHAHESKAKNIEKRGVPQKDNVVNLPLKPGPKMGIVSRLL
jgi:hypothetical protein